MDCFRDISQVLKKMVDRQLHQPSHTHLAAVSDPLQAYELTNLLDVLVKLLRDHFLSSYTLEHIHCLLCLHRTIKL